MATQILILDKIRDEIEFFRELLEEEGCQVINTSDDYKLLGIIEHEEKIPDLILINSLIHHQDSYLFCKEVKILENGKNIPIIFINRDYRNFNPEVMFKSGGSDYINYPFNKIEILHRIKTQLKIRDLQAELQQKDYQLKKIIPHYQRLQKALQKAQKSLKESNILDPITQLVNRYHFESVLNQEWLRSSRQRVFSCDLSGTNISLIMCKINDFAEYKEHYGKELTENCLNIVANNLKNTAKRPADLIAFFEEEKFAILLPSTDLQGAERVSFLLREKIKQLQIPHNYSHIDDYISISMGVATGIPTQALPSSVLIEVAENALKQAMENSEKSHIIVDSF